VTVDHAYDALNRLTRMTHYVDSTSGGTAGAFDAADRLRAQFEYAYDTHHQRRSSVEKLNHGEGMNDSVVTSRFDWVYDALGRLTSERYDHDVNAEAAAADFWAEYDFDLVGNRLEKRLDKRDAAGVDAVFAYAYDRNDRLVSEREDLDHAAFAGFEGTTFYEYDRPGGVVGNVLDGTNRTAARKYAGDLIDRPAAAIPRLSETTYEYNWQGRLRRAVVNADGNGSSPAKVSEYEYGDDGIRVSQTVDGVKTLYVVDRDNPTGYAQVLEEKNAATPTVVEKSYVIGLDVLAQAAAGQTGFLLADGRGGTRAVLDAAAAVLMHAGAKQLFAYDAYGSLIAAPGLVAAVENAVTSLLYNGEQTDRATGLQYLRARYYQASTGTFNRVDPFAGVGKSPQSFHKYAYGHGDPVNNTDPSGRFIERLLSLVSSYNSTIWQAAYASQFAQLRRSAPTNSVNVPPANLRGDGGYHVIQIYVGIENKSGRWNADRVAEQMQVAIDNARLPIRVVIVNSDDPPIPLIGRNLPFGGQIASQWRHSVVWDDLPLAPRDAAAATFNPGFSAFYTKRDKEITGSLDRHWANILLHEVLWLSILREVDVRIGGTPLSRAGSLSGGTILIDINQAEVDRIEGALGR
jgi:RHS repeat-associated protein